jgi:hypothetical protein
VGSDAEGVTAALAESLAERRPDFTWNTEHYVGRTPVDVVGVGPGHVFIEIEWRRADPANNTVKLFRHLSESDIEESVSVVQLFTRYYDLQSGGVSSKRENAEFVGERIASTFGHATYDAATLDIDPPKRGGDLPDEWRTVVADAAAELAENL